MTKYQISAETEPGSGTFEPVEVFEAADFLALSMRLAALKQDHEGAFTAAPVEPVQAPSA